MSGTVGGDPDVLAEGARSLHAVAGQVSDAGPVLDLRVGDARFSAGDAAVAAALARFGAAASRGATDTGVLLDTCGTLVANAADDLATAGRVRAHRQGVR